MQGIGPAPRRGGNGNNHTVAHKSLKTGTTGSSETPKDRGNVNPDGDGNRKGRRGVGNDTNTNSKRKHKQKESLSTDQSATGSMNHRQRDTQEHGGGEGGDEDDGGWGGGGVWGGNRALTVQVRLNARIDVIGDLTADVMPMVSPNLMKQVEAIPKHTFDYIVIPLEVLSKSFCDPLQQ